jgi:hypothetical protein
VIDQNQNKNRQGTANWIFVPFNEVNQLSSQTLTGRSLELRVLKIKKLAETISFIKEIQQKGNLSEQELNTLKMK